MEKITSVNNNKVKAWKKLKTGKGRKDQQAYLVEGEHLYQEALQNDAHIKEIIMTERYYSNQPEGSVATVIVSEEVMNAVKQTESAPGIVCVIEKEELALPEIWEGKYVFLDRVQDPGNAGTIVRTADAAGFTGVIFGTGSVDPYNDKVLRSMQGSHFHLPIYQTDILPVMTYFNQQQYPVYGTALDEKAKDFRDVPVDANLALILGNESKGVSPEVLEKTSDNLYIPIYGQSESLNVAVAAGILIYHFL